MKLPDWLKKRKQLLIVLAGVVALIASQPLLWPGGFGIQDGTSTTTVEKVEKDEQGNNVKTVETTSPQDGKTLWDWLSLLGVPLSLALLGLWFQQREKQRDQEATKAQQKIAEEAAKEETLQVYFDRISTLLVEKNLRAIAAKVYAENVEGSETQPQEPATAEQRELLEASMDVIRARTLSILRRFDNDSGLKGVVIEFLIEAEIINKLKLSLRHAHLSGAHLSGAHLSGAHLSGAHLGGADLGGADLGGAHLGGAHLSGAHLGGAHLSGAHLSGAHLSGAHLSGADLISADLRGANLNGANLSGAVLRGANLSGADLSSADLSSAILRGANLLNIKFNEETVWPNSDDKAINIPEQLKKQLGLSTDEPEGKMKTS